ncbi:hypothetical protein Lal_00006417 [Lupinus albus]|nr:hypothetical protein Lal_00006417 [Lupinus albus]
MDVRNIAVVVEDVDAARTALEWSLENIIRYGDIITLIHVYPFTRSKSRNKARLLRLKGFQLALSFQHICNNFSNTKVEIVVTEDNQEGMKIVASVREIGASILVVGLHDRSFLYKITELDDRIQHGLVGKEHSIASELQKVVPENLGTCTCLLNGDKINQKLLGSTSELPLPMIEPPKNLKAEFFLSFIILMLDRLAMANNNVASYFNCRVFAIKQPPKSPLSHVLSAEGVLDSSINMDFSQIDISRLQVPVTPPPKVKYRICPDPAAIIWRLRRSRRRR